MFKWLKQTFYWLQNWYTTQTSSELLTYLTIIITVVTLKYLFITQRKKIKFWITLITAIVINYILISSYYDCLNTNSPKDLWDIVSMSLLVLLGILVKALICFILYSLIILITQPDTLSEFMAKIFGLEIHFKRTQLKVDFALEKMEESKKQLDFIAEINEATIEYLSSPFEESILISNSISNKIREAVEDILRTAYLNSKVKIYVVSITDSGLNCLGRKLTSLVRFQYNRNYDRVTIFKDRIGVGIYRAGGGINDTAIVIDTTDENYALTPAEMSAISNLYVSISSIISWAQVANIQES